VSARQNELVTSVASGPSLWGYPVVLPNLRDPRLHLAAVIVSIHILGQTALGFPVTVPQILSAILASAILEIVITFRRKRQLVWPASAMLTGSGVALIFRVIGTERGDYWSFGGWYLFAVVAALSLATKYVLTYRGSQLFNPSNVGLVAAFLLLGSDRAEPLDFWWGPPSAAMILAYSIILVGGLLITSRLQLLSMAAAFWLALAASLGLVAASGHCITAAWSVRPLCGLDFWRIVMTSPEVLIFLFFMITDPKTTPARAVPRVVFGAVLGVLCALLMAPQGNEFGTKVALLGGLVLLTPVRFVLERRFLPATSPRVLFRRGVAIGATTMVLGSTLVAAAAPGNPTFAGVGSEIEVDIDTAALPAVTVDSEVESLNIDLAAVGVESLATSLVGNLEVERRALLAADPSLLRSVDHGQRLIAMEDAIETGEVRKERVVPRYEFDSLHLGVIHANGSQGGASLGLAATGTVIEVVYDPEGVELRQTSAPFSATFVLGQPTGSRWMLVDVIASSS
jgi:Na+-transporting NADH:ubiquinone oxidoreductase subunit NqrB